MNKVFLIGNLTKDPELHELPSGNKICNFNIAVSRDFGEEGADFFTIKVWNKQGENCQKYLAKGRKVAVVGRLQNRSYEDRDGNKRTVTEISADNVEFLSKAEEKTVEDEQIEVIETIRQRGLEEIADGDFPF